MSNNVHNDDVDSVIAAIATYYLNTESRAKANLNIDQNKSQSMDVNMMTTENVDKNGILVVSGFALFFAL